MPATAGCWAFCGKTALSLRTGQHCRLVPACKLASLKIGGQPTLHQSRLVRPHSACMSFRRATLATLASGAPGWNGTTQNVIIHAIDSNLFTLQATKQLATTLTSTFSRPGRPGVQGPHSLEPHPPCMPLVQAANAAAALLGSDAAEQALTSPQPWPRERRKKKNYTAPFQPRRAKLRHRRWLPACGPEDGDASLD